MSHPVGCTIDFARQGRQIGHLSIPKINNSAGWASTFVHIGQVANGDGHGGSQRFQFILAGGCLQIQDHPGLQPRVSNHRQGIAGGPALGIVIDRDVVHTENAQYKCAIPAPAHQGRRVKTRDRWRS